MLKNRTNRSRISKKLPKMRGKIKIDEIIRRRNALYEEIFNQHVDDTNYSGNFNGLHFYARYGRRR